MVSAATGPLRRSAATCWITGSIAFKLAIPYLFAVDEGDAFTFGVLLHGQRDRVGGSCALIVGEITVSVAKERCGHVVIEDAAVVVFAVEGVTGPLGACFGPRPGVVMNALSHGLAQVWV